MHVTRSEAKIGSLRLEELRSIGQENAPAEIRLLLIPNLIAPIAQLSETNNGERIIPKLLNNVRNELLEFGQDSYQKFVRKLDLILIYGKNL
jgi:hypothetical protein